MIGSRCWISINAARKIETRSDEIIRTTGHDTSPAFTVTKIATTARNYEINFAGDGDNPFGCIPTVAQSWARFENFVLAQ
jgi:hypothetical protein